jgi:transcriptional regulator with XRE-family HTH domain
MNIGQVIKDKRESKGLTQLDLSVKLGLSSSQSVSVWELGKVPVPLESLGKCFKLLNFSEKDRAKVIQFLTDQKKAEILTEILKGENYA